MQLDAFIACMLRRDPDCTADELADALWLATHAPASHLAPSPPALTAAPHVPPKKPNTGNPPLQPPLEKIESLKPNARHPVSDKPAQRKDPEPAPVHINAPLSSDERAAAHALPLRVPGGRALPGALDLGRALKPLTRRIPSRVRLTLDEPATVRRIAEDGIWSPVLTPSRARWLDLALVIDTHGSMAVWQHTLRELRQLLETLGAFRDVRLWTLDTGSPGRVVLRSSLHPAERSASELLDPQNRRLILIATDCIGPAWADGSVSSWLDPLARRNHVALWQLLPERLWRQTALRQALFVHVSSPNPATPNAGLAQHLWRTFPADKPSVKSSETRPLAFPVLNAEPRHLAAWSRLLCGSAHLRLPAVILPRRGPPGLPAPTLALHPGLSAEQRISAFRRLATPAALHLACLLSASPLRLPVMRLVQNALLPDAGQTALAEVFLGGLLRRLSPFVAGESPDEVDYDFHPGVRPLLLKSSWYPDVLATHSLVSDYLQRHFGQSLDFKALVRDPSRRPDTPAGETNAYFASITADVLERLGGGYTDLARHLRGENPPAPPPPLEPIPTLLPLASGILDAITLLWVDDCPDNNENYCKSLRKKGATVHLAKSTAIALGFLETNRVNAVISDLGRPEGKFAGFDLLRSLRARADLTPLAIFASHRAIAHREEGLALGAFSCTNRFKDCYDALLAILAITDPAQTPVQLDHHKRSRDNVTTLADTALQLPLPLRTTFAVRCALRVLPLADQDYPTARNLIEIAEHITRHPPGALLGSSFTHAAELWMKDALKKYPASKSVATVAARAMAVALSDSKSGQSLRLLITAACKVIATLDDRDVEKSHFVALETDLQSLDRHRQRISSETCPVEDIGPLWHALPAPAGLRPRFAPPRSWILVAGSVNLTTPPGLKDTARDLGTLLAAGGYGLVSGGWPGVDTVVTRAFLKRLAFAGMPETDFVRQIVEPTLKPDVRVQGMTVATSVPDSIEQSIAQADAVVLLAGAGGTASVGASAHQSGLPVFPLPRTGGDALRFYSNTLKRKSTGLIAKADLESLDTDTPLSLANLGLLLDKYRASSAPEANTPRPLSPLGTYEAHENILLGVSWHPDGRQFATCSVDHTAWVWDFATRLCVQILRGHTQGVNQAVWSPDGRWMATCSFDRTVRVWTTGEWRCAHVLSGHEGDVTGVAWSPDSRRLVTVADDSTVHLWNAGTGEQIAEAMPSPKPLVRVQWLVNKNRLAACSLDGRVHLLDANTLATVQIFKAGEPLTSLATNGNWLAASSNKGGLWVWQLDTGDLAHHQPSKNMKTYFRSLSFSPDGQILAANSQGRHGDVVLMHTNTGRVLHRFAEPTSYYSPCMIAWSPVGATLATFDWNDRAVRLWEIDLRTLLPAARART